jgi:hypothetical protein
VISAPKAGGCWKTVDVAARRAEVTVAASFRFWAGPTVRPVCLEQVVLIILFALVDDSSIHQLQKQSRRIVTKKFAIGHRLNLPAGNGMGTDFP